MRGVLEGCAGVRGVFWRERGMTMRGMRGVGSYRLVGKVVLY